MTTAPGWYPDPWGASLRWWDGERWTTADADLGADVGSDAGAGALPPPPPPAGPPTDGALAMPSPPELPGRVAGRALKWLVLSFVAAFAVSVPPVLLGAPDVVVGAVFAVVLYGVEVWGAVRIAESIGAGSLRDAYGFFLRWRDLWRGPLVYVVMALAAAAVYGLLGDDLVGSNIEGLAEETRLLDKVVSAVMMIVAAPVVEELFFRGLLLRALTTSIGPRVANTVQAGVFGLVHYTPEAGIGNVGLLLVLASSGFVFGWAANRYRSLGPGIVAHAIANAVAFGLNL